MDKDTEQLFTAIQGEFTKIHERLDTQDKTLKTILDIIRVYDTERKEIKSALWEFDRRLKHLEKKPA